MQSASGIWATCQSQYLRFPVKYVHSKMAISVKFLFLWVLSYQLDSDPNKTGSYSGDWWLFSFCHYNRDGSRGLFSWPGKSLLRARDLRCLIVLLWWCLSECEWCWRAILTLSLLISTFFTRLRWHQECASWLNKTTSAFIPISWHPPLAPL